MDELQILTILSNGQRHSVGDFHPYWGARSYCFGANHREVVWQAAEP
jgi:hypothetical protein